MRATAELPTALSVEKSKHEKALSLRGERVTSDEDTVGTWSTISSTRYRLLSSLSTYLLSPVSPFLAPFFPLPITIAISYFYSDIYSRSYPYSYSCSCSRPRSRCSRSCPTGPPRCREFLLRVSLCCPLNEPSRTDFAIPQTSFAFERPRDWLEPEFSWHQVGSRRAT